VAVIGIDLGGTKIQGVRLSGGEVKDDAKLETPPGGPDAVVAAIASCVDQLGGTKDVDAIGIGVPGVVDAKHGVIRRAPNLSGFDGDVAFGALVAEAIGVKHVVLENDVNAGTYAEHRIGAARDVDDVLGVFVGTGVGGGLVLDGDLYRGVTGAAGEIGHMVVRDGGRECGCGLSGHVESYAGRAAIEREARRRHAAGEETALIKLAGDGRMKSSVIAKALDAGDAMTIELLDEAVEALGAGIASVVNLLDLELVVVGGGVADKLGAGFVGRIEQATRARLFVSSSPVRVVPATLGDLAGATGAGLIAKR
jgi:glucokinase